MTRAIIFDVDGTLIDSNDLHARAWVEAFRHFGVEVPFASMRHEIGKGGDQLMPMFLPQDRLARDGEALSSFRGELFKREYLDRVQPFPDVPALFRRARAAGLTVALASSGKADEVKRYVEIAGIGELVDIVTTADDAKHSKPEPDIFEAALAKLAPIPASACVVVGDTPWDAIAALRAGVRPVGILCGGFPEAELREAGMVEIYRDPADLLSRWNSSVFAARA